MAGSVPTPAEAAALASTLPLEAVRTAQAGLLADLDALTDVIYADKF